MPDSDNLNTETRRIWNANAEWWDDRIGDGNDFQVLLVEPASERLIEIGPGTEVLDIACGAGRFARRMAELGAHVTAFDFSERFIHRARARTPVGMPIDYHVIDAADREALLALGDGRFDGAVATMALMDMAEIEPLFRALPALLKPGGWFVFSLCHPCFQAPDFAKFAEMVDVDGEMVVVNGVKISRYATPAAYKGLGIVGQPEPQYYFHRSLSDLLNTAFRHGFVLDGLEEPTFPPGPDDARYLRWDRLREIPPVLVARLRLPVSSR